MWGSETAVVENLWFGDARTRLFEVFRSWSKDSSLWKLTDCEFQFADSWVIVTMYWVCSLSHQHIPGYSLPYIDKETVFQKS